jgi:hypothetical protein
MMRLRYSSGQSDSWRVWRRDRGARVRRRRGFPRLWRPGRRRRRSNRRRRPCGRGFFDGVADGAAGIAGLGVDADRADLSSMSMRVGVHVDVAVAGEMLEHGDGRFLTTARMRLSPPRGMTRSIYLSSLSSGGPARGRWIRSSWTAAGSMPLRPADFGDDFADGAVGMDGFLAAAEDDGVAALDAEGGGVAGDVGAALVEEEDDAERHADFWMRRPLGRT